MTCIYDLITSTIPGQEYKSHSSLWNFLKPPVQSMAAELCIFRLSTINSPPFDSLVWINLPLLGRLLPNEDNFNQDTEAVWQISI
jgi:hypothetical protein